MFSWLFKNRQATASQTVVTGTPMKWSEKETINVVFHEYERIFDTATPKSVVASETFFYHGEKFQFEMWPKGGRSEQNAAVALRRLDGTNEALWIDISMSSKLYCGRIYSPRYNFYFTEEKTVNFCHCHTSNRRLRRLRVLGRDGALRIRLTLRMRVPIIPAVKEV